MECKRLLPGDPLEDAFAVRFAVFVDEQGFSRETEIDEADPLAHHVLFSDNGRPVATGRVFEREGKWVIGRVAALGAYRGSGLGRRLMEELEALARDLGARSVTLGAQCRAEGFYSRCGYRVCGEVYLEENCPHIDMSKALA